MTTSSGNPLLSVSPASRALAWPPRAREALRGVYFYSPPLEQLSWMGGEARSSGSREGRELLCLSVSFCLGVSGIG